MFNIFDIAPIPPEPTKVGLIASIFSAIAAFFTGIFAFFKSKKNNKKGGIR